MTNRSLTLRARMTAPTTGIITAIYGGYDTPSPLPPDHGFDQAVLVTDTPVAVAGWDVVVEPYSDAFHPRLKAKVPKCMPQAYLGTTGSVWIDGAYRVRPGSGFRRAVDEHLTRHELVAWAHPDRATRPDAYAEARFTHDHYSHKYEPRHRLLEQAAHYRAQGLPERSGLYAAGTVARHHTPRVNTLGADWLLEQFTWTVQDQVSLPYVAWAAALDVGTWCHEQWANPWLDWHGHRDET